MRQAKVYNHAIYAGLLIENDDGSFDYIYDDHYNGPPISLTMPVKQKKIHFKKFPPFFDGVLPEGFLLAALLKKSKLDQHDYFGQLILIGKDLVGSVTVEEIK